MHLAAVRCLAGNAHPVFEFATTWPNYDLDEPTRPVLGYAAGKLTETPGIVYELEVTRLRETGWNEPAIGRSLR